MIRGPYFFPPFIIIIIDIYIIYFQRISVSKDEKKTLKKKRIKK